MAKTELTSKLISRFDRLSCKRQNWETHWQEVADYMLPRKAERKKFAKMESESSEYTLGKKTLLGT